MLSSHSIFPSSSGKCQIAHWRQGHKDECRPPLINFPNEEPHHDLQPAVKQELSIENADKLEDEVEEYNKPSGRKQPRNDLSSHIVNGPHNITVAQIYGRDESLKPEHRTCIEAGSSPRSSFDYPRDLSPQLHGSKGHFPYELFVKLYSWNKVELIPCGLQNCGNSCYANAVLQCLAFTPPLTAYFLQGLHSRSCDKKRWCFTCELERLIFKAKERSSPVSPIDIFSHVQRIGSNLAKGREEDAHEFLRCAVDSMQSICLKEAGASPSNIRGGKPSLFEETNLIGLTFGGYIRSKIRCMRCRGKSQQDERIMDLSVEIDGDIETLEEALTQFTSTEYLDGENKYQCNSYERAEKKLIVVEAPNILSITLKRYRSGKFGKLNKSIKFPEILNFAPYMGEDSSDPSPVFRLYGVVVHLDIMNSTFSGHYMCYIRNAQRRWFAVDDSSVQPVEQDRVLGKGAYMLFYSRHVTPWCSPRAPRSTRDNTTSQEVINTAMLSDPSRVGTRISSSKPAQSFDHDDHRVRSRPIRRPESIAEVDSWSDSSSIFSHSDEASSTSTDSYRDSSSVDDLAEAIFGNSQYVESSGWRNFTDSDASSPSSTSSSPLYPKRSPLFNSKRYTSGHSDTMNDIKYSDGSRGMAPDKRGTNHTIRRHEEVSCLHSHSSSNSELAREIVYGSTCKETDPERVGWPNSSHNAKPNVYARSLSSRRD
ncbi:Ubiquitin carboxyl-terminal hydrolase 16-like protein [Drosera capensis]